jgi:hypothetical protein
MKPYLITSMKHSNHNQRMLPFYKIIMWMSVFLLFVTVENVYSQEDTLRCMLSDTCETEWETSHYTGNMGSGITGTIWYRFRDCNGVHQIMIDSTKALDNGNFLDSVNRYHFQYTTFSDLADLYLLQHRFRSLILTSDDPDNPTTIVQLYKASCGIWVGCTYDVDPESRVCDMGFDPPYPVSGTVSAPLTIYKWQPCGKVCCQKTYEVYLENVDDNNVPPNSITIVKIKSLSITRSSLTPECTEQPKYVPKPCLDGC